ncbi:MAG: hypothetical protein ALECFALPRED_007264 [Alectoria fallacina]|uniref:ATP-grasp domain-containing protein n=1 Tax=Alectoria fallacina TaxID=1903189 RepID=A0A8H3GCG5_9LECA|nr:MAG: hypothetical protein ALECFALPRED_007264 [Alectoria fallacina]
MLDARSPHSLHFAQNASLVVLSLLFLPLSTLLLFASYVTRPFLSNEDAARKHILSSVSRRDSSFRPKTVLVTGVGKIKGLFLARAFYKAGHNVIGADFEPHGIPVCGRFSKALRSFYSLPKPNEKVGAAYYIDALLQIVRKEKVDLWVSCSGVVSALEDGQAKEVLERRSDVRCIQFDVVTTQMLREKDAFVAQTQRLGLPTLETHKVTSRAAVHKVLNESPRTKKRYIMKSVSMDDASRGITTILPKRNVSETYNHVSAIPISGNKPWILQQYIKGREYCTHALIVNDEVKAFVACPSSEFLMHYEALPADSTLSRAMLRFTEEFVRRCGSYMIGHLSFNFLIEEIVSEKGAQMTLLPIDCNPRVHTAVVLFHGQEQAMAEAYLTALTPQINSIRERPITNGYAEAQSEPPSSPVTPSKPHPNIDGYTTAPPEPSSPVQPVNPARYYWLPHDLVTLLLLPLLDRQTTMSAYLQDCQTFLQHLLLWKDGTYEVWDPLPAWWLYHAYWPGQFWAKAVMGGRWSRVDVSTGKIF